MDKDTLIAELEKWTRISKSADPMMEIELAKSLDFLRNQSDKPFTAEQVSALEKMIREPQKLPWRKMPSLPDKPLNWTPSRSQIEWFRTFIEKMNDVAEWEVSSTGQRYRIDKKAKTFTLIKDTDQDINNWHERNKMILGLLGYTMIDNRSSAQTYSVVQGDWILAVFDFSIDEQENPRTPGKNFPPGSRGHDAVATASSGVFVRLGHNVGRHIWKAIRPPEYDYGTGKTTAPWKIDPKGGSV